MALIHLTDTQGENLALETSTINSIIDCGGRKGIGALIFFDDESHIEVKETFGEIVEKINAAQLN